MEQDFEQALEDYLNREEDFQELDFYALEAVKEYYADTYKSMEDKPEDLESFFDDYKQEALED